MRIFEKKAILAASSVAFSGPRIVHKLGRASNLVRGEWLQALGRGRNSTFGFSFYFNNCLGFSF